MAQFHRIGRVEAVLGVDVLDVLAEDVERIDGRAAAVEDQVGGSRLMPRFGVPTCWIRRKSVSGVSWPSRTKIQAQLLIVLGDLADGLDDAVELRIERPFGNETQMRDDGADLQALGEIAAFLSTATRIA